MKVQELIELLKKVDEPNRIIVLSSDAEGNKYSPLGHIELGRYLEENKYRGEVYPDKADVKDSIKSLIIYPSN